MFPVDVDIREVGPCHGPQVEEPLPADARIGLVRSLLAAGVRHVGPFDGSIGGPGGSPFADGAAGNLATEDLVHLCDDLVIETSIDLDRLLEVSARVADLVGPAVPSRVAAAGARSRRAS